MSQGIYCSNFLGVLVIACVFGGSHENVIWGQEIDAELLNRFRTEAPEGWATTSRSEFKFFNSNSGWRVDYEIGGFTKYVDGRVTEQDQRGTNKWRGRTFVSSSSIEPQENTETITVLNPQYMFKLSRPIGSETWTLIKAVQRDGDLPSDWYEFSFTENGSDSEYLHELHSVQPALNDSQICPFSFPKSEWFDLPDLQFRSIGKELLLGNEVVKVEVKFSNLFFSNGKSSKKPFLCTAFFDPNRSWTLVRAEGIFLETDGHPKILSVRVNEFETEVGGFPFRTSYKTESFDQSLVGQEISLTNSVSMTSEIGFERLEPRDFTLSAFGLPEPDWYIPTRPWWLYASLSGMALLVVGAVVLRYGKQLWKRS